jgi:aldose 1-epimerase
MATHRTSPEASLEELRSPDGAIAVEVAPDLGARLHRLRAFGHDLLRTPPEVAVHARDPFFWGAYVMAPWCNRIAAGRMPVAGRILDLPSNFPDGTAIHGQVYVRPWERVGAGAYRVEGGGDGWPWRYEVESRVAVEDGLVLVDLALANRSDDPMPAGVGLHPWFRRPVQVAINAARVHRSNLATEPIPEPVAGPFDLRSIGDPSLGLDATWADLDDPAAQLRWPDVGLSAALGMRSTGGRFVVAAAPADPDAVALEPQTHAPQGLRRLLGHEPGPLAWLEPGASLRLRTTLAIRRD